MYAIPQSYPKILTAVKSYLRTKRWWTKRNMFAAVYRGPRELNQHNDWRRPGRSGDRNQVGARFSAPVQTGPLSHPASSTKCTRSFPVVKLPGRGVDHPPPPSVKVKVRVQLYLYSHSVPSQPVLGWHLLSLQCTTQLDVRRLLSRMEEQFQCTVTSHVHSLSCCPTEISFVEI